MKFSNLKRIYDTSRLTQGYKIDITGEVYQYFVTVLRFKIGDFFRIFNEKDGEFLAETTQLNKKHASIIIKEQLRAAAASTNHSTLTLALSIIKSHKMLDAINMATQLGVDRILPIIAVRSQVSDINSKKTNKIIIEATEQSERLTVPLLLSVIPLKKLILTSSSPILYANEKELPSNSLAKIISNDLIKQQLTLLIGPEGGFTKEELALLTSCSQSYSFSLSPNVLRSETAVVATISQINLLRCSYQKVIK